MCLDAQVSDRALIQRVIDGDPQAAELFVARFTRLVWWILFHQIRLAHESAEEVYQDVFVRLWEDDYRRLRVWSGEGDLAAYLAPIVRHRALDYINAAKTRSERQIRDEPQPEAADECPGPEERIRVEQQRSRLERAVAGLAEKDRTLYELRFVRGLSYRQIARDCDITVNNVGVRLNRLVEMLRTIVAERVRSQGSGPSIH